MAMELVRRRTTVNNEEYEASLRDLQIKLGNLQHDVRESGRRVLIVFEGRDAAGKGGAIRRFTENLSPREHRIVALPKPTDLEKGQWYFQRYIAQLPNAGEMVFFDRSWYNRAVVEPVMGFCTKSQYKAFMERVGTFEELLVTDGIEIVKLWFAITKDEQRQRFEDRANDPLRQWKLGPIDKDAQRKWSTFSKYATAMLANTSHAAAPWTIVRTDSKKVARLESIRIVLDRLHAPKKTKRISTTDADVVIPVVAGTDFGLV